jgi:hypothetical protein
VIQPLYSVRQIWASLEHWRHRVSFSYRHYSDIETKASRLAHPKAPDATVRLVFLWAYTVQSKRCDSNSFVLLQICESLQSNDWKVEHPNPNAMGPYAYKGNQWVGYDDINIVQLKVRV